MLKKAMPMSDQENAGVYVVDDAWPAQIGGWAITLSLAVIFIWFGCLKFTDYEASGIAGFVMNSPLIGWLDGVFGIAGAARFLGVFEIVTGILIAARFVNPRLSVIGGVMGAFTFFITLSLMFTTPGVIQFGYDSPLALSAVPGQFLLKDLGLFAGCLWVLGASLVEARMRRGIS